MVTIRKQLVRSRARTSSGTNGRKYITVHQTGNTSRGADAAAHANLQSKGNVRSASWHYTVDDTEAVQSYPHTVRCWHAGDGTGDGNYSSIGVEHCVNSDGDYAQTLRNGAELVAKVADAEGIPTSRIVQHNHWTGKDCPTQLRDGKGGISWADYLAMVDRARTGSASRDDDREPAALTVDGKWGPATTRRLQEVLDTTVDGVVSNQSSVWRSQNPGLKGGWDWTGRTGDGGSKVIRALQKVLDVTVDGKWGPATARALQRRLGTTADGWASDPSAMVRALQKRLNKGKV